MDTVLIAVPPRRVVHTPTGDVGWLLGVDALGYQTIRFDGEQLLTSIRDDVLGDAGPADEVAAALRITEQLLAAAAGVDAWLERQETYRANLAAGHRLAECWRCAGDAWEKPCPDDQGGYVSCVLCDDVYDWGPGDFGDCPQCGPQPAMCQQCLNQLGVRA